MLLSRLKVSFDSNLYLFVKLLVGDIFNERRVGLEVGSVFQLPCLL